MFFKSRSTETGEISTESGGNARIGRLKSQTESFEDKNGEQRMSPNLKKPEEEPDSIRTLENLARQHLTGNRTKDTSHTKREPRR